MPNIRSQKITDDGIEIIGSDGRVFRMNKGLIRAQFVLQTGTDPEKRQKAAYVIKELIAQQLGTSQLPPDKITFDFDEADGRPIRLEISSGD